MQRVNRTTYWLMLALCAGAFAIAWIFFHLAHLPMTVAFVLLSVGRLHDIGRTGWLAIGLFVPGVLLETLLLRSGEAVMAPGTLVEIALLALAILAGLLFLGTIPGQPGANKFGGPPGQGLKGQRLGAGR